MAHFASRGIYEDTSLSHKTIFQHQQGDFQKKHLLVTKNMSYGYQRDDASQVLSQSLAGTVFLKTRHLDTGAKS